MLSCTSSNNLTKGEALRVPQNIDHLQTVRTLERGIALLGIGQLTLQR